MAKVSGGLFSFAASGTFANVLTFNSSEHSKTVRLKPTSSNKATTQQAVIRHEMTLCAQVWRSLPALEKKLWGDLIKNRQLTAFSKFTLEWHAQRASVQIPPYIPSE